MNELVAPEYYQNQRPGAKSVLERVIDRTSPSYFISHNNDSRKVNERNNMAANPNNMHLPTKKVQVINILKKISKGAKS